MFVARPTTDDTQKTDCAPTKSVFLYINILVGVGKFMEPDENKTVDAEDVFAYLKEELGLVHEIYTIGHTLPLYGRLVAVNDLFITIQKREGRSVALRKTEIRSIRATHNQPLRESQQT